MGLAVRVESVLDSITTSIEDFRNVGVSRDLVFYQLAKLDTLHVLGLIEEAAYAGIKTELESLLYS